MLSRWRQCPCDAHRKRLRPIEGRIETSILILTLFSYPFCFLIWRSKTERKTEIVVFLILTAATKFPRKDLFWRKRITNVGCSFISLNTTTTTTTMLMIMMSNNNKKHALLKAIFCYSSWAIEQFFLEKIQKDNNYNSNNYNNNVLNLPAFCDDKLQHIHTKRNATNFPYKLL